jgi:hypothetical protein
MGSKTVPTGFKLGAELFEIVNLAVGHHPHRLFLIGHRLMSAGQIDDGEPSNAKADRSGNKVTLIIGAAVNNRRRHPLDRFPIHRLTPSEVKLASYAAHLFEKLKG